MIRYISI